MSKPCTSLSLQNRLAAWAVAGLLAACGGGGGGDSGGGGGGGAPGGGGPVTISGKAMYEFPPPRFDCQGLDFNAIELRPIRQATIQVLDAVTDALLDEDVTADTGDFALTVEPNTNVYIRVRAELQRTDAPAWNVQVRDNTVTEGGTLDLKERPLYVLDTAPFDSGNVDLTRNVTAATGWNNSTNSYTGARSAAPFAVLDTAYAGMLLVLAEEPETEFEPLEIFWSVNNKGNDGEIADGDIGTSFYRGDNSLFLLGFAGSDADEFDDHVVAHEWGHYFEDSFSRSDSIGGAHSPGDALDMRVAFGEGFATALAGMALDNQLYCDTFTSSGFSIDIESEGESVPGWFSEISVMKLIYDLWDTPTGDDDGGSLGFGPIHSVMTGSQAATRGFTSIFSFATALKAENPLDEQFINELLRGQQINPDGINEFGEGETNDAGPTLLDNPEDVLPVYTTILPDGTVKNICSNSQFDQDSIGFTGNKLSEHRFLRMVISDPSRFTFTIKTTTPIPVADDPDNDSDQSDPDILILKEGVRQNAVFDRDGDGPDDLEGFSGDANQEIFTTQNVLPAGDYVMALVEFRYQDVDPPLTPDNYPARTCFDVSVAPAS